MHSLKSVIRALVLVQFLIFKIGIVNCQVCKLIVDSCNDESNSCSECCESMCNRNFGVCVPSKGISYCHCFNTEARKNWQSEFKNKYKAIREKMLKEKNDDSSENESKNEQKQDESEIDEQSSESNETDNQRTSKNEHEDL